MSQAYAFAQLSVDRLYPWTLWPTASQMVGGGAWPPTPPHAYANLSTQSLSNLQVS